MSLIAAIDFDGTITATFTYPDPPCDLRPLAREAMCFIKEMGHTIILWTCRSAQYLDEAVSFMEEYNIPFDYVNENTPEILEQYGRDNRKVHADVYIDDKNIGGFIGWRKAVIKIIEMEKANITDAQYWAWLTQWAQICKAARTYWR